MDKLMEWLTAEEEGVDNELTGNIILNYKREGMLLAIKATKEKLLSMDEEALDKMETLGAIDMEAMEATEDHMSGALETTQEEMADLDTVVGKDV